MSRYSIEGICIEVQRDRWTDVQYRGPETHTCLLYTLTMARKRSIQQLLMQRCTSDSPQYTNPPTHPNTYSLKGCASHLYTLHSQTLIL